MADQPHDPHMTQAVASKKPLSDRSVNGSKAEIFAVRSSRIWVVNLGSSEVTSSAQQSNSSSVPSMVFCAYPEAYRYLPTEDRSRGG